MKYLPILWAGLWRKKLRTIFTLLSIVIAFLLFGMLQGINAAFSSLTAGTNLNRLYVQNKYSFIEPLPMAHATQIASVPGVTGLTYADWFGGYYQDLKNQIFSYAVDPQSYLRLFPEMVLPEDQKQAFFNTRTGAIIGQSLAQKYGWKIGDRIPLISTIWVRKGSQSANWEFDIVGIFTDTANSMDSGSLLFNAAYFDEAREFGRGTVGWFVAGIDDISRAGSIGAAIDARFANSANETQTQTEKEYAQAYAKQMGDINFIVSAIIGAVFFALLFLTGNTMMQSVRERTPELAVLKALGFTDASVAGLVVAEALVLCGCAAILGLALASLTFPVMRSVIGIDALPVEVVLLGVAVSVVLALVTALAPALRARRLSIIEALVRR